MDITGVPVLLEDSHSPALPVSMQPVDRCDKHPVTPLGEAISVSSCNMKAT